MRYCFLTLASAAMLTVASGCCGLNYGCCGGGLGIGPCGSGIGCADSGMACADGCDDAACADDGCASGGCGSCWSGYCTGTPLTRMNTMLGCGAGCGGIYWGEWQADPPDCSDPCDCHGNYIGGACPRSIGGPWSLLGSLRQLWGYRYGGGCCETGCADCCGNGSVIHGDIIDGEIIDGEIIEGDVIYEQPEEATPMAPTVPQEVSEEGPTATRTIRKSYSQHNTAERIQRKLAAHRASR